MALRTSAGKGIDYLVSIFIARSRSGSNLDILKLTFCCPVVRFLLTTLQTTETEYIPGGLESISMAQERLRAGLVGARKLIIRPQETI